MKIHGKPYRTIWPIGDDKVGIIDQTKLLHVRDAGTRLDGRRGACDQGDDRAAQLPIGPRAAQYGVALAMRVDASDEALDRA